MFWMGPEGLWLPGVQRTKKKSMGPSSAGKTISVRSSLRGRSVASTRSGIGACWAQSIAADAETGAIAATVSRAHKERRTAVRSMRKPPVVLSR